MVFVAVAVACDMAAWIVTFVAVAVIARRRTVFQMLSLVLLLVAASRR